MKRQSSKSLIEQYDHLPKKGDAIRTRKTQMEGRVERLGENNEVFFRLPDGRLMKTPVSNIIVVEKLADSDDAIMEHLLQELIPGAMSRYKRSSIREATAEREKPKVQDLPLSNSNFFMKYRASSDNLTPLVWQVRANNAPDDILTKGTASNLKDATQQAEEWIATKSKASSVSKKVTVNFNVAFAKEFAPGGESLWCDIRPGPTLLISADPVDGFTKTNDRGAKQGVKQRANLFPVMTLLPDAANAAGLNGNSRYKIGSRKNVDGNDSVYAYELVWDSNVEQGGRRHFDYPIIQTFTQSIDEAVATPTSAPKQPPITKDDFHSRRAELQRIQMDPETSKSPETKKQLAIQIAKLRQRAQDAGLIETYRAKLRKFAKLLEQQAQSDAKFGVFADGKLIKTYWGKDAATRMMPDIKRRYPDAKITVKEVQ